MTHQVNNPVFARVYARVARIGDRRGGAAHRRHLVAGLTGRVLELGAGSGSNFAHYPTTVSEVIAVEPEPHLRERAQAAASKAPIAITVLDALAEALPAEDGSVDAAVAALVLCTVPDQPRALAELYRVIQPGGELRFYEHVLAENAWQARFQRLADATVWPTLAGGCHMARNTGAAIERAGFTIETCECFPFSPAPPIPPDPHILGIARRPE